MKTLTGILIVIPLLISVAICANPGHEKSAHGRKATSTRRQSTTSGRNRKASVREHLRNPFTMQYSVNVGLDVVTEHVSTSLTWRSPTKLSFRSNATLDELFQRVLTLAKEHPTEAAISAYLNDCTRLVAAYVVGTGYDETPANLKDKTQLTVLNKENGTLIFLTETDSILKRLPIWQPGAAINDGAYICERRLDRNITVAEWIRVCMAEFNATKDREYLGEFVLGDHDAPYPAIPRTYLTRKEMNGKAFKIVRRINAIFHIQAMEKATTFEWSFRLIEYDRDGQHDVECILRYGSDETIDATLLVKQCRRDVGLDHKYPRSLYERREPICIEGNTHTFSKLDGMSAIQLDALVRKCDKIMLEVAEKFPVYLYDKDTNEKLRGQLHVQIFPELSVHNVLTATREYYKLVQKRVRHELSLWQFDRRTRAYEYRKKMTDLQTKLYDVIVKESIDEIRVYVLND